MQERMASAGGMDERKGGQKRQQRKRESGEDKRRGWQLDGCSAGEKEGKGQGRRETNAKGDAMMGRKQERAGKGVTHGKEGE